jgi:hypothetical protein
LVAIQVRVDYEKGTGRGAGLPLPKRKFEMNS